MDKSIVVLLKSFNRKERFYLIGHALGNEEFRLSDDYRMLLEEKFRISVPEDAFVAMDYHLDWVYASLFLSVERSGKPYYQRTANTILANQEDIDLLVAFERGGITHLFFLEAKGVTPFSNKQLESKTGRLRSIFEDPTIKKACVRPYFAIVSPRKPSKVDISFFPEWMKTDGSLLWIELPHLRLKLERNELMKIERCDGDCHPSNTGEYWRAVLER